MSRRGSVALKRISIRPEVVEEEEANEVDLIAEQREKLTGLLRQCDDTINYIEMDEDLDTGHRKSVRDQRAIRELRKEYVDNM
jgi:hypothetical protein